MTTNAVHPQDGGALRVGRRDRAAAERRHGGHRVARLRGQRRDLLRVPQRPDAPLPDDRPAQQARPDPAEDPGAPRREDEDADLPRTGGGDARARRADRARGSRGRPGGLLLHGLPAGVHPGALQRPLRDRDGEGGRPLPDQRHLLPDDGEPGRGDLPDGAVRARPVRAEGAALLAGVRSRSGPT